MNSLLHTHVKFVQDVSGFPEDGDEPGDPVSQGLLLFAHRQLLQRLMGLHQVISVEISSDGRLMI